jgi:uncharacterized protein
VDIILNQNVVISERAELGLNILDGFITNVPEGLRQRLLDVKRHERRPYMPTDLPLLEAGLVRLDQHAARERTLVRELIRDHLAESAALCVMTTEKCNFRCTYCYEKFEKGRILPEIERGVVNYLRRNMPNFKTYSLGWFGGEPLLHPEVIANIGTVFREVQAAAGIPGSIAITTNGSLLNARALQLLRPLNIDLFHVSVDGPAATHDAQRRTINGHSTYNRILDNLENLLEESPKSTVLFRVNQDTRRSDLPGMLGEWLTGEIVPRFSRFGKRIKYHVVSIWDATTSDVDGICLKDTQRFQRWLELISIAARSLGTDSLSLLASEFHGVGSLACYAGKPNHYVVGPHGTLYKCTVAFDLPENQVGTLRENGDIELNAEREAIWIDQNSLTDPVCGNCAFQVSCMGLHCPLTRLETGTQPCPTPKRFIGEILSTRAAAGAAT